MSKFEDNLWADLERDHAPALLANVTRKRRVTAGRWLAAAAVAAVLGTAAAIAPAYFGGTPPAYAVVDNPDGSVTLTLRELSHFEEATAKLREHGVPAVAQEVRAGCRESGRKVGGARDVLFKLVQLRPVPGGGLEITIVRHLIPPGTTVGLAVDEGAMNALVPGLYASDAVPGCLPTGKPR